MLYDCLWKEEIPRGSASTSHGTGRSKHAGMTKLNGTFSVCVPGLRTHLWLEYMSPITWNHGRPPAVLLLILPSLLNTPKPCHFFLISPKPVRALCPLTPCPSVNHCDLPLLPRRLSSLSFLDLLLISL